MTGIGGNANADDAPLKNMSVLVIDDSEYLRNILRSILRTFGITAIREAADGQAAFKMLGAGPLDVVICDIEMAPINGIAFLKMLRAGRTPDGVVPMNSINPKTPVIMLTAHAQKALVDSAREAGANGFLVKPIKPKLLLERLKAVAGK